MLVVRGLLCAGTVFAALEAAADPLPVPTGDVVLTIAGDISETNVDGVAQFDLAMLQNMGAIQIETTTIWTEGPQVFEGVPLIALIEALGAEGSGLGAERLHGGNPALRRRSRRADPRLCAEWRTAVGARQGSALGGLSL